MQIAALVTLAMSGMTYPHSSWMTSPEFRFCKEMHGDLVHLKLRGGSNGDTQIERAIGSGKEADGIPQTDLKARTVYQMQLDACQRAMDCCYESRIRPQLDALEQKMVDGSVSQLMEFRPYHFFGEDASKLLSSSRPHVETTIQALQVQLEVIQYVGMGDGNPVSTVDFERMPVDFSLVRRMVSETRRELISATEKALESLWMQHKALVEDYFFEQFERRFDGLIGGSQRFNATAKSLSTRLFRECEAQLKRSVPRQKVGLWEYRTDLDTLQQRILTSVESRRRLSGLDDLMKYFKDESPKAFSPKWFKHVFIRAAVTYVQFCQSAWAYRKARGIPYPRAFTKEWLHAVLVPWRVSPLPATANPREQSKGAGGSYNGDSGAGGAGKAPSTAGTERREDEVTDHPADWPWPMKTGSRLGNRLALTGEDLVAADGGLVGEDRVMADGLIGPGR